MRVFMGDTPFLFGTTKSPNNETLPNIQFQNIFSTAHLFQRAITFSLISIINFPCSGKLYVGSIFNLTGSILFVIT